MDEDNIREIARGHGWPEDDFLKEVNRLRKGYAYTDEGALAQVQKHYARKFGVNSKESRLRKIARNQGFDEGIFLKEHGRLIAEGRSDMDALSQTMKLFEKSAKIAKGPTLATFGPKKLEELERAEIAKLGAPPGEMPRPPKEKPIQPPKVEVKPKTKTAYDKLIEMVGNHYVEIYSDPGCGKSRLVHHIAVEAQSVGKKVLYIDVEGSLPVGYEKTLSNYEFHTAETAKELMDKLIVRVKRARNEEFDFIIVDSLGISILVQLYEMGMRERGDIFQAVANLRFQLMAFAHEHGLAIGTNQPISELAYAGIRGHAPKVGEGEPLPPSGGKSAFIAKLILRAEPVERTRDHSTFKLVTWKARDWPFDHEVARYTISSKGVSIEWKI